MKKDMINENPLGTQSIKKLIWAYSIPSIISQLINSLHNIVDQVFIGWGINDLAIGATNITFPITTIMTAVSALIGMGAASRFSIMLGKKQHRKAAETIGTAVLMLVTFGALISIILSLFLDPILYLFGATDLIMEYAHPYARIICLGVPLGIFAAGMSYFIRADGSPTYASIVLLSGAGLNMILDPIFLFGLDMGISGIAAATVLGQLLSTVLALLYLLRKFKSVSLSAACMKLRLSISGIIFKLGMATFTTHVLITASQIIQMNALRTYGALSVFGSEVVISASGVVSKLTIVLLSSVIGIAMGCQPIWGYNLGNKKFHRVKQTYLLAIRYGSYVALASFLLLQLFPQQILSMFGSEDPLFYEFSTRYIRIFFMMLFLNALQPITSMFCTAIGKAGLGVWMAVFRHGLLLISLLLILPPIMGIDGVLFAGCISDAGAALMVVFIGYYQVKRLNKLEQENTNQAVADTTA